MSKLRKFAKISAIVIAILLSLAAIGFWGLRLVLHSAFKKVDEAGQHVVQVDWLPKEASDVTYLRQGGLFWLSCYECALPRSAFDKFAKENGWAVKETRNVNVGGFRSMLKLAPIRLNKPMEEVYPIALHYQERQKDGGGITVVYDLETQRLFVWESSN